MKRHAFTLIELLISIALFGLITLFLFGAIDQLRGQYTFYQKKEGILKQKNQIIALLRGDLDRIGSVDVFESLNPDFDSVSVIGSNHSLYGGTYPYVVWLILKKENTLVRMESASPIVIPIRPEALFSIHSDVIGEDCEQFRVCDSLYHRLIYLKFKNQDPLIVETVK